MILNRNRMIFLAVGIGTLMTAMSSSVVNIVLPVVTREFGASVATMEWVIIIALLVTSGLLLSFGRLGDLRGHKVVYVSGFVLFAIASPLCGLAMNAPMLIALRALQALGAAMVVSNSPAILTRNFPGAQRGQVLGLQSMMTYLGLTLGPSLGGWLTSQFTWRAAFFINVPVGLVAIYLSQKYIPRDTPEDRHERFDLIGAGMFLCALVTFLFGLNQGHAWGWDAPAIWILLTLGIGLMLGFVLVEQRVPSPMLDLSLFRTRLFSAAVASAVLNYICVNSVLFLMPFYLIQGRGFDPAYAGLLLAAQPVVMAMAAPLSGTLSDRIGSRTLGTLGMLILACGAFLLSRLNATSSGFDIALGLALFGLGTGMFTSPNSSALMGSAPRHRQGVASGVMATARSAGMALGVGIAGAIFSTIQGGDARLTIDAISAGLTMATGVGVLGALTSAVRGNQHTSGQVVETK